MLYKPHTKRRHKLNADYWKAINPRRFKLPECEAVFNKNGVVIHHHALMGPRSDMDDIARAVAKLVENVDELRKVETGRAAVRNPAVQR
jgi:L-glutamine:2-deoxy-scyllo-inosose/3-amino-2,3-dideoxy-scyllo-inosose aminotransferase